MIAKNNKDGVKTKKLNINGALADPIRIKIFLKLQLVFLFGNTTTPTKYI